MLFCFALLLLRTPTQFFLGNLNPEASEDDIMAFFAAAQVSVWEGRGMQKCVCDVASFSLSLMCWGICVVFPTVTWVCVFCL